MIECDRVRSQLSALIDGELPIEEAREVQNHLQRCAACQQEWGALNEINDKLARALTISDIDCKCEEILTRSNVASPRSSPASVSASWRLVALSLLVVAASILMAVLPFFTKQDNSSQSNSPKLTLPELNLVAQLKRATGPVQCLQAGETDWSEVIPDGGKSFAVGSRLRTNPGVLCEIETTSKGVLRMNQAAEIVIVDTNRVELIAGQIWCLTPSSTNIEVVIPETSNQAAPPFTVACPSATELQCAAGDRFASCDSTSKNNSTATMTMGAITCSVAPGETVSMDREQKIDRKVSVDAVSKIWQLPLIATGVEGDEELILLLDRILAPVGMGKAISMNEQQLRMLGPAGAIPLLAYASADKSSDQLQLRRTAVRLASDLVDERGARLLTKLTLDSDEYISRVAKAALERIHAQKPKTSH